MAISFHRVTSAPIRDFDAAAPDGVVIGIIGENGAGKSRLLRLAAGIERPVSGSIDISGSGRFVGPDDPLELSPAAILAIDQTLAHQDALVREKAVVGLDRLRRT